MYPWLAMPPLNLKSSSLPLLNAEIVLCPGHFMQCGDRTQRMVHPQSQAGILNQLCIVKWGDKIIRK